MQKRNNYRNLILGCCMTGIVMLLAFFFLYHTYIQDIIYKERLNQMEEITRQMFQNLEDVIDSHWDQVTEECNYLKDANVQTTVLHPEVRIPTRNRFSIFPHRYTLH